MAKKQVLKDRKFIFGDQRFRINIALCIMVLFLAMASPRSVHSQEATSAVSTVTSEQDTGNVQKSSNDSACKLSPIVVPTLPDKIPGYTELDPETQLHVTGKPQVIDFENYRLEVSGKVNQALKLKYNELRCMPKTEARPTLVCPGFFKDTATWAGVSLKHLLQLTGVQEGADTILLQGADGYSASVSLEKALAEKNFLAYELEGKPVPVLHGFPLRAVFPDLQGDKWVKWLIRIEVH